MGEKVQIKLVAANLEKQQLDFEWIPGLESLKQKAVKSKKNKSPKKRKQN
jgi:ribonuclease R